MSTQDMVLLFRMFAALHDKEDLECRAAIKYYIVTELGYEYDYYYDDDLFRCYADLIGDAYVNRDVDYYWDYPNPNQEQRDHMVLNLLLCAQILESST